MSYTKNQLRAWADQKLHLWLRPDDYPEIHTNLRRGKLGRIDLGLLRIMVEAYRPERSDRENMEYANFNAITKREAANKLDCRVSQIEDAKKKLNKLAKAGARDGSYAKKNGMILFHGKGIVFRATMWDAMEATRFSDIQKVSVVDAHESNIALASEKNHEIRIIDDRVKRFASLPPEEQARILATVQ